MGSRLPKTIRADEEPAAVRGIRQGVYIALALFFFVLGVIGVALPGLPTTPFLLLTSYFLLRSSPRWHGRLVRLPMVGRHLRDWNETGRVRRKVKVVACAMVFLVIAITGFSQQSMGVKIAVTLMALYGVWVVIRLPSFKGGVAAPSYRSNNTPSQK